MMSRKVKQFVQGHPVNQLIEKLKAEKHMGLQQL